MLRAIYRRDIRELALAPHTAKALDKTFLKIWGVSPKS